ncbi:titin-like isoform X2 [Stylophora pistillata]|uniref:titin-like isoform X2 n=1 Tax=Stylophora pistillata TaxID=50429 RepID=UPI000C045A2C|nr:titin-like isoform X2 [Stylophora pistillata]
MRTEVFGVKQKPMCYSQAIGVARSGTIPDSSFSASSEYNSVYAAKYGRLNNAKSWAPRGNSNANDYLQIDLLFEYVICAVATQGNPRAREWTTKYKLRLSLDNTNFFTYQENSADKVFDGNSGQNDIEKHSLDKFTSARYIRFQPTAYSSYKGLRVELYGIRVIRVPSQSPSSFTLTASSSTSITASWQLPSGIARNGRIRGFKLFFRKKGSAGSVTTLTINSGATRSRVVTGLDKYTEYELQVLAFTSAGDGPKSSVKVKRTLEDVPSQPPSSVTVTAVTSTIVRVSWQLPPVGSRNGIITGFKLFLKRKSFLGLANVTTINNGATNTKDFTGLFKYTEYEFQMLAFTSAGDGPKSSSLVERTLKDGDCVDLDIGMEGGEIQDNEITASSAQNAGTPAKNGRLNYTSGSSWCAGTSDSNPYLQIDLQTLHIICAVSTQGNSQADQWVKTYKLQLSTDGTNWEDYKEGGQVKVLEGNANRNSVVKHPVYEVLTRYLRFLPQTHHGKVCMRTEVFGVKQNPRCSMQAIGVARRDTIPDSSFSALSEFSSVYAAKYGRLNGAKSWAPRGNNNANDYLQIDLLFEYVICAVATQGNPSSKEWTTKYKIRLSLKDTNFVTYQENNADKVFNGNSGKNDIVKQSLNEFASAKYIRFQPTAFSGYKGLRVEVYGIRVTQVPSPPPGNFALTANSSTSIEASWQLPPRYARHGIIAGFKLFYKKRGSQAPAALLTVSNGATLSTVVTGLEKYTVYEFKVLAFTSHGDGARSPPEVQRTMEDVPSRAPGRFNVTAISSTSITVSWQLPPANSRHGIITGFKLYLKKKSFSGLATIFSINDGASRNKVFTGLDKYTEYEFHVLAFTSVGDGPKTSVVLTRTKEDVPSQPPSNFTVTSWSSTSIEATWTLPPANSRNGLIRGFKLLYKKKTSAISATSLIINSGARPSINFYLTGLEKYTEYEFQVLAFTSVGDGLKSSVKVEKTMEDAPSSAPTNFTVTASSPNVIKASWQLPPADNRNGIITGYKLFYKRKNSGGPATMITITSGATHTKDVTGLVKYTEYEFQVLAFTSVGDGPKSSVEVMRTVGDVPTKAPSNFVATASSSTSITVSWQLPPAGSRHGIITGFKLFYKEGGSAGSAALLSINSGATFSKTVTGLDKYTEYEFQVLAFTSVGDGPKSSVKVERTMEDAPSKPPSSFTVTASSSTSITASWRLPSADSRHGIITGFKLYYKRKGSVGLAAMVTVNNGTVFAEDVPGLEKYTEYEFQVLAFTSAGDGPKSSVIVDRTNEDVPSKAPSNLSVTARSSTSVTASWQLPPANSRHGIITGYKLFYKIRGSTRAPTILSISSVYSGAKQRRNINGLMKYTEYQFQVLAFTSAGDGPKSLFEVERTMEDVPSKTPLNFTVAANSSTSITASWQLPPANSRHGIIKGFKLFYRKKSSAGSAVSLTINNGSTLKRVFTGLDKYIEYEFQVLAFTSAGEGPKSSVILERTMEDVPSKPPRNFTVTVLSSTRISAFWQSPPADSRNGIITGFKLFYQKRGFVMFPSTTIITNRTTRSREVSGLEKYTDYEFRMLAFTSVGDGVNSSVVVERTKEDVPSYAPLNFTVTSSNSTSVTAAWRLPPAGSRHGIILGFKLFYRKTGSLRLHTMLSIRNGTTRTVLVTGLDKNTEYEFQVLAFTSVGDGPKTSVNVEKTKEDVPFTAPSNLTVIVNNSTSVTASWQLPLEIDRNGVIRGFRLLYRKKHSGGPPKTLTIGNGTTHSQDVAALDKYTEYEFQILAFTSVGDGPKSTAVFARTKEDVPSRAPANLTLTSSNSTSITASWQLPPVNFRNGIIRGFKLFHKMKDSPRKQTMLTISNGASRTKELTGLAKYTEYEVRLLAFTSVGDGPKSVVKFVKTNEDIPSKAPGNFSLAATSSTSIKAFWQLPPADSRNGIVRGFRLFYKRKDSLELQTLVSVKNGTTRSKLVTGLDKYTVYEFQVLAFTSVGDGINSSIVAKRTKEDVPSIAPSNLTVAVINSTSVTVSWQVRPEIFSNGIIGGFKLFYRKNSSAVLPTILTIKNGTIHRQDITGLDRYTRYEFQVLAFTSVGDGPKSAVLVERTKEDVPSQAPGNFTVTTGSSTSITAAWQLPQVDSRNGIISGFKLFYRKKSSAGKEITLVIANGTSRSKTLTGLAKYTEYEFELLAFTSVGDGPKSSVKVAKTKEDIPSKAPGNFTLCPASSTRITVSWKLPPADSRHGILRGFKLFYRKKGPAGLQTVITIKNGTDRSKLVTGLEKYTEYEFQMLAFTSVGDGPKTPLRFERTNEDVPYTAPRNLTVAASNSTSVTVSWQLPPEISRNGVIRGLKVLYREKSSAALPRILTINNGTIESQAVTGLDKYTQYDFQVVAFTSVGDGPRSSVVVERTKEDVPSQAPSNFTVTSSNSTSIEVMWQLPPADSRNGIITGYKLFYKKNGSAARPTWLTISNGTTHYKKLTGLAKYTKYEFQLLAFTSVGDGPKSSIKVGETNEDAPSKPPSNFTVKASSSTSIGASWQLPPADSRHGIIIGFKLYYQKRGSPTLQTLLTIKNGKVRSKPVTGLAQFTEYEFQVLAFTSVGDGPKSSTMVERTKEDAPSQAPSNFSLIVRSSTSISTSWQLPPAKSRNGIITGFKVFFKKKGSAKLPASITINGTTQTKDVTELEKYTEYEFQVLAFTSVGDGPKSYVRIKRTKEDVPSKSPRNFTVAASSSSSMTASWQLPPKDSRNGIVRGFKLLFKKRGVIGLPNTLTIGNGTVRTRDVFGLDKYTEYEFQVLAFTSVGDGAKSSAKVARTKEDAPSKAPSNFSVMASNSTSITAFWQLPPANSRNGIITGFKLFFRKRGSARLPVDLTISNGQIRFKHVTGLNKYSEYEFQVLAFTSVGDGPRSTVVVMRTMEDVPSHSPRNFSVTARSSTTVTASWQLPSVEFRHGFIIGFKISYQKKDPVATTVILNITNGTVETIEITGLDKYTEYEFQILAFTSAGNGPWSPLVVRRTKEDVPTGSPDNFTVVVSSSTSITATWQLPPTDVRNGIITGFKLFYRKKEFLHLPTTLTITNSTSRRKIVTGLDKYTEYQFQVLAFTFVGEGPNSPVKVQRTAEDVPSGSPSNFILTASSSTSITASWQLPPADSRNGIILGFNLFYKIKGSGDLLTMITINNGTASNEDVTGLEKYTEYEFQMLAFTSVGDGPNSSVKIERTREDVPSKSPSNFTVTVSSSTSIMTSWHLPPEDFRNGRVQGFKLYYKKKGSTGLPNTITIRNGTFLTKDFIGLEKYTEYEFQVLAFTSVGDGPKSSVEVARTKEDVPSKAPGNFSVTASNSTAITATWQLPPGDSRNGIITGFKLFFVKKGSAGLQVALTISNGQIRFKHVNGLDKYTEYEFQVLAFTSVGDGPRSAVVVERTMEDVPSRAPSNLNVTASSSTSVTASWQLPSIESRHGIITGFKLSYRENVTTAAPVILNITNGTVEAKDIAGLDKYTEYEFQVLAFTSVGDGPKSPVVVVRTEEDVPSRSPNNFTLVVTSSTSITVSWQLPPVEARNGIITGFKLFYKKKGFINLSTTSAISNGTSRYKIVTGLDKYTEYEFQMLAFTSVGDGPNSSVEVERTAEDAPSKAPENFTVTAHSSTSITAYWQLPPTASRNGIIVGFKLFYKKIDSAASATMIILNNGTINIRNVTGLDEYAEYEFQLLAFTPVGDGPKSSLQFAKTMEDVPSEAPTNFTLTASSSTSITVGWQLPPKDSRNGVITGFKLFYKNKGSILAPTCLTIYNGTTRTRVAAKLDEYTEYEFQVSAFTSVGDGPKSSVEVERTMEDVPSGYPSNFTVAASSSTSITTFWQLPPTYSRNGIIVGFKLFYKRKRSGGSATMITINNGTTDTKNITGLVKYTEYEFQMLAFTSVGDGPNSSVEITRTKEDVPSKPPSNFSVTASSSTSITASWQLPSANFRNGIITGYKLLYKKKHSVAPVTRSTVFNVSIHTENITGLDKYTEYEFQVLAFTSVGDGSKSSLHVERTKEDAPSKAPANVSVTAKSSTSFIVSWQPPPENGRNGIITGFKLFYKERSSEGTATTVTINGEASLRRDVSGLNKYTEYEFQVLAFTSAGEGPTSAVKVERTKEDAPSSPLSFSYKEVAPNAELHGPRINLTWSKPTEANGIIRSYTVFYANQEGETNRSVGGNTFSYLVDVLGGVTYHFYVRAVTIKPGQNASFSVKTYEYEPSRAPENVSSIKVEYTKYQITWDALTREVANGLIKMYQVRLTLKESCTSVDASFNSTYNTTKTEMLFSSLSICTSYEVSVRAFTEAGPGPYSKPLVIQTLGTLWSLEKPSPPAFSTNSSDRGITAKITFPNFPGHANFFQVIVITYRSDYTGVVNPQADFTTQDLMTYEDAHKSPLPAAYVTFQFGGDDFYKNQEFTVGDGVHSSSKIRSKSSDAEEYYYNKPLQLNTNYRVFLRAFVSEALYTSSSYIALKT